jgi:hypothetical protein
MGEFKRSKKEELTDEELQSWLENARGMPNIRQDMSTILAEVKEKCKFDPRESDPGNLVTKAVSDYIQLNLQRRWNLIEKNQDAAVQHLLELAQPAPLSSILESDLSLSHASFRNDFLRFVKHLRTRAIEYEQFHPLRIPKTNSHIVKRLFE